MARYSFVLLVGLCAGGTAAASSWADGMFTELSKDFGSVPRGPTLHHSFTFTNNTREHVHIASVRVSCGCVTAAAPEADIPPGKAGVIQADMDTRRFTGIKTVTIYVQFDQPRWEEVRLWVQANGRDDVTVSPDSLAFGQVRRGSPAAASVNVSFLGNGQTQIVDARCNSNYVKTSVREARRDEAQVAYQVTARLRPDIPVGRWYTDIWLQTTDPSAPRVRVPLTVDVEGSLTVSPESVTLGEVKVGDEAQRKVIVRGARPFRIKQIKGADGVLKVRDSTMDSKPVHVLTLILKPTSPGDWTRTLQILTDLDDEGEVEFQARADVVP